jgi:hypothetical protein
MVFAMVFTMVLDGFTMFFFKGFIDVYRNHGMIVGDFSFRGLPSENPWEKHLKMVDFRLFHCRLENLFCWVTLGHASY